MNFRIQVIRGPKDVILSTQDEVASVFTDSFLNAWVGVVEISSIDMKIMKQSPFQFQAKRRNSDKPGDKWTSRGYPTTDHEPICTQPAGSKAKKCEIHMDTPTILDGS